MDKIQFSKKVAQFCLVLVVGTLITLGIRNVQTASADPTTTISGTLRFSGIPAPLNSIGNGVDIDFIAPNGSRQSSQTNASGQYLRDASSFAPGNYKAELQYNAPYPQQNSALTHMPNSFLLTSTSPIFDYAYSSIVQDFDFDTKMVAVTVKDHNGALVSGRQVELVNIGAGTVSTSDSAFSFTTPNARVASQGVTNSSGVAAVSVFPGLTYRVCVTTGYIYPTQYCAADLTVTSDTTAQITYDQPPTISGAVRFNGSGLTSGSAAVNFTTLTVSGDTINGQTNTDANSNYAFNAAYLFARSYGMHLQYNVSYLQNNSAISGVPNTFLLKSTTPLVNYGYTNATQDLSFATSKLTVAVKDAAGNPISTHVYVTSSGNNTVSTTDNSATFKLDSGQGQSSNPTINGLATVSIFRGVQYNACALIQNVEYCQPVSITADSSLVIAPLPGTPSNLAAVSPTMKPALSWTAASGAISYKVYRDTTLIASTATTAFTDTTATEGAHSYYVKASNAAIEGAASNAVSVMVDTTRPTVTFLSPTDFSAPFAAGPVVTVNASDANGLQVLVIHVYNSANQLLSICGTATPAQLAAGEMSCDLASLPSGAYSIKTGSFDKAGNNRTVSSGSFTIL